MFDLHVHAAPDIKPRLADDLQILRWYADAGYSGCVLKGHYDSTVGRAIAASANLNLTVYGGQALNQHVGGINPAAVAAALAMGARMIWMPTTDSHTQQTACLPRLCNLNSRLSRTTYAIPPVDWGTEANVRHILTMIADADAVLATGHLSAAEVAWLCRESRASGVRRLLLTHPTYTVPAMSPAEVRELTDNGAFAEITAIQLFDQPDCDAGRLAELVRVVGYDRIVLSSDAGQPLNPTPPEALAMLIDALVGEGLDRSALIGCASDIPERLVVP